MVCFGWVWMHDEWYVYNGVWGIRGMIPGCMKVGMISTWLVYDELVTYMCGWGHRLGMSNNESWWLVKLWYGWHEEKHLTHDRE